MIAPVIGFLVSKGLSPKLARVVAIGGLVLLILAAMGTACLFQPPPRDARVDVADSSLAYPKSGREAGVGLSRLSQAADSSNIFVGKFRKPAPSAFGVGAVLSFVSGVFDRRGPVNMVRVHASLHPVAATMRGFMLIGRWLTVQIQAKDSPDRHMASIARHSRVTVASLGVGPNQAVVGRPWQNRGGVEPLRLTDERASAERISIFLLALIVGIAVAARHLRLAAVCDSAYPGISHANLQRSFGQGRVTLSRHSGPIGLAQ